ncbi:hypothetical protein GV827_22025 [Sulfitobacter sp. JBTF-M27]|uniref:Uncharacterized protein n=1 Tax=Sulfitobacter sediminilitoris TaxID=2698830 RepID=A0A6P0CI95_9RHOB|nr:hypothetical protein [Sulfitobacter sediminilitoris]NEK25048.1 hypothetical protein [Sulfitobacter sediminilitoris]
MKLPYRFGALILGIALSSPALAQELEHWGSSDYWDVMIDPSLGDGCLIQSEFTDGSVVRIGFDPSDGGGYVTVFNMAWGDIEQDEWYSVLFDLDGEEYEAEAQGMYLEGVPGADIPFDNPDFLFDIAKKYTMTLYNEQGEVMSIDLTGSYAALEAAIECQEDVG